MVNTNFFFFIMDVSFFFARLGLFWSILNSISKYIQIFCYNPAPYLISFSVLKTAISIIADWIMENTL